MLEDDRGHQRLSRSSRIALSFAIYALVAAAVSFTGWLFDVRRLADWDNDGIAILPNTTVAGMALAFGLISLILGRRPQAILGASFAGLIGITALFENVFRISLGIDELLLFGRTWGMNATTSPGRMGMPASTCLSLLSVAVVLATNTPLQRRVAARLALTVMLITLLSLIGYLFGARFLYSLPAWTAIALQTSMILAACGMGLLFALRECFPVRLMRGDGIAASLARRTLPVVILGPILLGYLAIQGARLRFYDAELGAALLVLVLITLTFTAVARAIAVVAERETLLRVAIESAQLGVFEWNPESPLTLWHNARVFDIFGRSQAAGPVTAEQFRKEVCHPGDVEAWERAVQEAFKKGRPYFVCCRIFRPDGEMRWVELAGQFAMVEAPGRMLGTVRDVTDAKLGQLKDAFLARLDDALRPLEDADEISRTSARLLSQYLKASRCAYADVEDDADTFNLTGDYNDGVPSIVGRYRFIEFGEECLRLMRAGQPFVVEDSEIDLRCTQVIDAFRATAMRAVICVPLEKAGRVVAAMALHQQRPRKWRSEEIELLQAVAARCWESIERTRVLRELATNEHRLRMAQEAGRIGTFEWLISENQVIWSSELELLYGLPAGSFEGSLESWMHRVVPDDAQRVLDAVQDAMSRRQERMAYEFRAILPDGPNRWIRGQAQFQYRDDGTPVRMIGVNIDIDDQTRATEAIRAEDRRKTQFLATLAHELRNPLAPVRNGLELLRLCGDDPQQAQEVLDTMDRQLQQMVRLIDDLLDVSRITQGKIHLRREQADLRAVLTAALETARPNLESNGIELIVQLPPGSLPLFADTTRLAQVFANLLNNAAKYTPRGGTASLAAEIDGLEVVIRVSDTGIGIPAEMLTHIFAMFTQVDDSIERSHGGLGIGLSLVKALVEMHGGAVSAASPGRGQGSVFTVRLPLGKEAAPGQPASNGSPITSKRPLRIIVVDDNVDAARTLGKVLELKHHRVTVVNDSRSAITTIERERPDLVLLDLGLPEISGYDVARAIRKHEWSKSVYISALTGWGQEEDRNRTREAGFDHHFVKPVEMAALFALLDKISVS